MKTHQIPKKRAAGISLLAAFLLMIPLVAVLLAQIPVSARPVFEEPIDDPSDPIPAAQLYADDEPIGSRSYTNGAYIKFVCDATCYVMRPGDNAFVPYYSGTEFHKPGKYLFYGESSAGVRTGTYSVVIDRTEKPLIFDGVTDGVARGIVSLHWEDGDPDLYAPVKSVTVNDRPYRSGASIFTVRDGVYYVLCVDAAGNRWESTFRSAANNLQTKTLRKEFFEADDREGEPLAFASYEAALRFSVERERETVRTGNWQNAIWDIGVPMDEKDSIHAENGVFYLYKKSGDAGETVAYFTEERLNEVLEEYAAPGVRSYYYWEKTPAPAAPGEDLYVDPDGYEVLGDRVVADEFTDLLLDGEPISGHAVETEGNHILTVCDAWGNTCDYLVHIVRRVPTIRYSVGGATPNTAETDRVYRLKDPLTVTISDALDAFAMFRVYNGEGTLLGCFGLDESFPITESGTYSVVSVNHFGESEPFRVILSLNAPTIRFEEDAEAETLRISVQGSSDAGAILQSIQIERSADHGETWETLEKDDFEAVITTGQGVFRFQTGGTYRVRVTDEFRTGPDAVTAEYEYTILPSVFLTTEQPNFETPAEEQPASREEPAPTLTLSVVQDEVEPQKKADNRAVVALVAVGGIAILGVGTFLLLKKRKAV